MFLFKNEARQLSSCFSKKNRRSTPEGGGGQKHSTKQN